MAGSATGGSPQEDDMPLLIHRASTGEICFYDDWGGENIAVYTSPDIGNAELVQAAYNGFGVKNLSDRDYDITAAIAYRRRLAIQKQRQALSPTVDPAVVTTAVKEAINGLNLQVEVDDTAIAASVKEALKADFAAVPAAVNDDLKERL
jgi:hypothetical protein